jgi:hypothetical protein
MLLVGLESLGESVLAVFIDRVVSIPYREVV